MSPPGKGRIVFWHDAAQALAEFGSPNDQQALFLFLRIRYHCRIGVCRISSLRMNEIVSHFIEVAEHLRNIDIVAPFMLRFLFLSCLLARVLRLVTCFL